MKEKALNVVHQAQPVMVGEEGSVLGDVLAGESKVGADSMPARPRTARLREIFDELSGVVDGTFKEVK